MNELGIPPDGWTLSFEILLNQSNEDSLFDLWHRYLQLSEESGSAGRQIYSQKRLQPWAYNILLFGLSAPWRRAQTIFDHRFSSKAFTRAFFETEHRPSPKYHPSVSLIWEVYSNMRKVGLVPSSVTHASILKSFAAMQPIPDAKALRKARSKLVVGKQSRDWSSSTFEAVFAGISEIGTAEDLEKVLEMAKKQQITLNRAISDSVLKFYSLSAAHENVLSFFNANCLDLASPPTHTTFVTILSALTALPEFADVIDELVTVPLVSLLGAPTTPGAAGVGPATFDALVSAQLALRNFAAIEALTAQLTQELAPAWAAHRMYGFAPRARLVLSDTVLAARMAAFGARMDAAAALPFLGRALENSDPFRDPAACWTRTVSAFEEAWKHACGCDPAKTTELERVLVEMGKVVGGQPIGQRE
ncbi:hypothetical protein HDU82_008587 [Entophlyctis luteolus]|nr:hypothetical protein HDU82_008587 [Entophlyctis luteolus]